MFCISLRNCFKARI